MSERDVKDIADQAPAWQPANPGYICPALVTVDPIILEGQEVPRRRWLVDAWIPWGNVTMLSGDGGVGKSLLAQQLITCAAMGLNWLGQQTEPVKTVGVFCEDDQGELHRRQAAINEHLSISFEDLENMLWVPRVGQDNALMRWEQWEATGDPTELFQQIHDLTQNFGAQLVVLDSLHDLFSGNENSRPHARQFIQLLHSLARDMDGAVLLCAHPSLSERNTGTGEAGSTAWNNAVRSRLYLKRPQDDDGEDGGDRRVLRGMKANYARSGNEIRLTWSDGVFVADKVPTGFVASLGNHAVDAKFVELLAKVTAEGRTVSENKHAGNYAPRLFARRPERDGYDKKQFEAAMERLFAAGRLEMVNYGREHDRRRKLQLKEPKDDELPFD